MYFFSSPEPKTKVSFFYWNLSVVRHRRCRCRTRLFQREIIREKAKIHWRYLKIFLRPTRPGQFLPKLTQNNLGWRGSSFFKWKVTFFQGEVIPKNRKYAQRRTPTHNNRSQPIAIGHLSYSGDLKIFFSKSMGPISTKHDTKQSLKKGNLSFTGLMGYWATGVISKNLHTKHPSMKGIPVCSDDGARLFSEDTLTKFKNLLLHIYWDNFDQTWRKFSVIGWRELNFIE